MTAPPGLDAAFTVRRGGFRLAIELHVPPGGVTVIVGPNGAGKSTALRTISGLLRPDSGRISSSGRLLDDVAAGVHVPPADRGIGVVFQDYLLFPHLSTVENVAFGPRAARMPRDRAMSRAHDWLDRLGIADLAAARPGSLSGGQAQRVALARALVLEPALLLLDEPLAALDASTRLGVRTGLAEQLRQFGGVSVIVTHDPVDAFTLADHLVVLDRGDVVQRGAPADVARTPKNTYVADLLGLNLLPITSERSIVFSPSDVELSTSSPIDSGSAGSGSAGPGFIDLALVEECVVHGVEQTSGRVTVRLRTTSANARLTAEMEMRRFAAAPLLNGDRVWASVETRNLHET